MHVVISGAGIAGLSLALCLQRAGHTCVVVEKSSPYRSRGYMLDFFGPGYDVAERLGLIPDIAAIHFAIDNLSFRSDRGRVRFKVPYPSLRKIFGDRHFNFLRGDSESLLLSRLHPQTDVRFSTTIVSIVQDSSGVTASLSDGAELRGDVLVGADGFHSGVRSLVFGEESRFTRFVGFNTAAFILPRIPSELASSNDFSMLTVPSRQVAVYPIGHGRAAAYFAYRSESPPRNLHGPAAVQELRSAVSGLDWIVPDLFERIEPGSFFYDQVAQIEMPRWSDGRVILLGDACYCVSLLAGQGASLAVAGAYLLAQKLHSAADVPSAAAFYENRLRRPIEKKQLAARKFARWFIPASSDRLFLRDLITRFSGEPIGSPDCPPRHRSRIHFRGMTRLSGTR